MHYFSLWQHKALNFKNIDAINFRSTDRLIIFPLCLTFLYFFFIMQVALKEGRKHVGCNTNVSCSVLAGESLPSSRILTPWCTLMQTILHEHLQQISLRHYNIFTLHCLLWTKVSMGFPDGHKNASRVRWADAMLDWGSDSRARQMQACVARLGYPRFREIRGRKLCLKRR